MGQKLQGEIFSLPLNHHAKKRIYKICWRGNTKYVITACLFMLCATFFFSPRRKLINTFFDDQLHVHSFKGKIGKYVQEFMLLVLLYELRG
jgi:hypothetical protein